MIDYEKQEHDRVNVPFLTPSDEELLFGANAGKLDTIAELLRNLYFATVRQESPAPGFLFINTAPSRNDTPVTVRWRCQRLVYSSSAAGTLTLKIGTMNDLVITLGASNLTMDIAYPRIIDPGIDVTMVASGGAALNFAYLVGYPETETAKS